MTVRVFNTLGRKKEELRPRDDGRIGIYVCGPTVYDHIHVGNARAFIVFDVVRRYLRWRGFDVKFVQNYTDVDDKIINKANEEGRSTQEVTKDYSAAFEEVMSSLGVEPPDELVKATDHIPDMQKMIAGLIEKGFAYEAGGNVWFAVEKFRGYGKLSGRSHEDLTSGERIEPDPSKKNPLDFALWKAAKPGEPSWTSPWGEGRPGWHIECSAMSLKQLGIGFDIHGGGSDLVFPHHENEIAQSEAFEGAEPFVRYWLHNGMVNIDEEKMSKSLRNFIHLKDLLGRYAPAVVRLLAINAHYRSDVDFGESQLDNAKGIYERFDIFRRAVGRLVEPFEGREGPYIERFIEAMDDDFNTLEALAVLHDLVRAGNVEIERIERSDTGDRDLLAGLLGQFLELTPLLGISFASDDETEGAEEVERLIQRREEARRERRFEEADELRRQLQAKGVVVEDSPSGPRWRRV